MPMFSRGCKKEAIVQPKSSPSRAKLSKTPAVPLGRKKSVCSVVLRPRCTNACIFCTPRQQDNAYTRKEWSDSIRNAHEAIREFRAAGFDKLEVSGGDPLEYRGLPELIKDARRLGFAWIRVSTNGVRLSDRRFAQALLKSGVDIFRIPLYGADAGRHDMVTGAPGSFDATVRGIRNIKSSGGARLLLTSLLLKQTKDALIPIFDFIHELGCDDLYFSPAFISNEESSFYIPYIHQGIYFRRLIKHAIRRRRHLRFRNIPYCVLGFYNDFTDNQGDPAFLGSRFQPSYGQETSVPDLPRYRRKIKVKICAHCVVSRHCDGFLVNDILRFGVKSLEPIVSGQCLRLPVSV